jgi:hypothetical protein
MSVQLGYQSVPIRRDSRVWLSRSGSMSGEILTRPNRTTPIVAMLELGVGVLPGTARGSEDSANRPLVRRGRVVRSHRVVAVRRGLSAVHTGPSGSRPMCWRWLSVPHRAPARAVQLSGRLEGGSVLACLAGRSVWQGFQLTCWSWRAVWSSAWSLSAGLGTDRPLSRSWAGSGAGSCSSSRWSGLGPAGRRRLPTPSSTCVVGRGRL